MYITILAEYMHSAPLVFYAKESQIMPHKALGGMFTFAACSELGPCRRSATVYLFSHKHSSSRPGSRLLARLPGGVTASTYSENTLLDKIILQEQSNNNMNININIKININQEIYIQ